MPTADVLKQLQGLPLEIKIEKTKLRIREWYDHWEGDVYVSFSGGKDSVVLLKLVRELYPEVPAVFIDTKVELPEIRNFVKEFENVTTIKPKYSFAEVVERWGYPIVSKENAMRISRARKAKERGDMVMYYRRINGYKEGTAYKLPKKWLPLLEADFRISDYCCRVLKKDPAKRYGKETGRKAFIGSLTDESVMRKTSWQKVGCNAFDSNPPKSTPLSFWTEQDILHYIKQNNIKICSVYGEIIEKGNRLELTGIDRTGCYACGFGLHMEKEPNRLQRLKEAHPKMYDYVMQDLGLEKMVDFMNENCKCSIKKE